MGSLPFRIINTPAQARSTNLNIGMVQWMDTGWELPEVIYSKGLKYESFGYKPLSEQKVIKETKPFEQLPPLLQPEFFSLADGTPLLCHYKKGSMKINFDKNTDFFSLFTTAIDQYLFLSAATV